MSRCACALAIGLAIAGCGRTASREVIWWTPNWGQARAVELVRRFEAAHPGVRVRIEPTVPDGLPTRIQTALRAGSPPDVIDAQHGWVVPYAQAGLLQPLDDALEARDDYSPGSLDYDTWDGKLWGLPYRVETHALIATNQVEMHPFLQNRTVAACAAAHDVAVTAYMPIAQGLVSADPVLRRVAGDHGVDPPAVSLAWLLQKGAIVIPASSHREHLEAELHTAHGRVRLRLAGGAELPVPTGCDLGSGRRVDIGIRPEHLVLADAGLEARVLAVEPTGAATHVTLKLAERTVVAVVRQRVALSRGSTVRISVGPESMHLFDPTTGERIQGRS